MVHHPEIFGEPSLDREIAIDLLCQYITTTKYTITPFEEERITIFHGESRYDSLVPYFQRIAKYGDSSSTALIAGWLFIERLIKNKAICVNVTTVYRLLLLSIMTASKLYDDDYLSNGGWAKVGGVRDINLMEIEYLRLFKFELFITSTEYSDFCRSLVVISRTELNDMWLRRVYKYIISVRPDLYQSFALKVHTPPLKKWFKVISGTWQLSIQGQWIPKRKLDSPVIEQKAKRVCVAKRKLIF